MTNPFSGIITADMKTLYTNMIDSLLEATALTVPCRLVYGETDWTLCPNCTYDPVNNRSSGIYNGTGPRSFTRGMVCPICNGRGKTPPTDNTKSMNIMVLFNSKEWLKMSTNVKTPGKTALTLSKITTHDDIVQAQKIVFDTDIEPYGKYIFQRVGDPEPLGWGADAYILTTWEQTS